MLKDIKIFLSEFRYSYKNELRPSGSYILNDRTRSTVSNRVNLHRWISPDGMENIGDYLSDVIVRYMLSQRGIIFDKPVNTTKHLYAVGSILQMGLQNATVWGSGYKYDISTNSVYDHVNNAISRMRKLDIRCVRGPETRRVLRKLGFKCPEIYGDPAVLMPLIYRPKGIKKTRKFSVVRHWTDDSRADNIIPVMTTDYKGFIDDIASSELVVSSSLHGIILAEAYGVPAVMYIPQEHKDRIGEFKFRDYYYSTGRYEFPIAPSVEEALTVKPPALPDLKGLQDNLLKSFPYDLWE